MRGPSHESQKIGFTLAELLVVVAIIGVLVSIAIPVFSAVKEKASAATCLANRTSMLHECVTEFLLGESADSILNKMENQQLYVCPSGGKLSCSHSDANGWSVSCNEHADSISSNPPKQLQTLADKLNNKQRMFKILNKVMQKMKDLKVDSLKPIGSTAGANANYLQAFKDGFASVGITLNATWAFRAQDGNHVNGITSTYQFYWAETEITNADNGKKINVLCYNSATGKYEVRSAGIQMNGNYPILNVPSDKAPSQEEQYLLGSSDTAEEAYKYYQTLSKKTYEKK